MAEIAGLVLGGIPITIWALDKYAEPFEAHHRYRFSIQTLQADLTLQHKYLLTTLSRLGLDDESSTDDLQACLDARFPSISCELMFIVQSMNDMIAELRKKLELPVDVKLDTMPQKAQWEWRRIKHSFSIKKRTKLIGNLRRWNDDLKRSIEITELPIEDDSRKVEDIICRFNLRRCDTTRQDFRSLHRVLQSSFHCACSIPHQAAIYLDWQTYDSDESKPCNVAVSYITSLASLEPPQRWRKIRVTKRTPAKRGTLPSDIPTPSPSPTQSSPPLQSRRSKIVQFALHSASSEASSPLPTASIAMAPITIPIDSRPEIADLCNSMRIEHSPWTLTGFLADKDAGQDRNFYLDDNKTDLHNIVTTIPVKSLISPQDETNQHPNPLSSLTTKQRFGIAAALAWSVLYLSNTPWMGEHWDQSQASVFLERNISGREILSRHPCASSILASSPPQQEQTTSSNEFVHLIPNKAVFTLGILLVELCINKSLTYIQTSDEGAPPASLFDYYQTALKELDGVYRLAGDSYGYAAERCLKCSFQGQTFDKDFESPQFRKQFHHTVVAPVQATYLAFPGSHDSV